jgi:hypothetical protein
MTLKTFNQLLTFVQDKLDIRDEDFVSLSEMYEYTEEAIKYCEAEIHKLNIEDQYFVAHDVIPLVQGQDMYSLPPNMYANKVLKILYANGTIIHDIKRMKIVRRFESGLFDVLYGIAPNGDYRYMLTNLSSQGQNRVRLYPKAVETSNTATVSGLVATAGSTTVTATSGFSAVTNEWFTQDSRFPRGTRIQSVISDTQAVVTEPALTTGTSDATFIEGRLQIWYIRRASIPTTLTDLIDFPEFWHFIAQFVLVNCLKKELGNPRLEVELMTLKELKDQMLSTLANMVPDQDDEIEKDISMYNDMGVSL